MTTTITTENTRTGTITIPSGLVAEMREFARDSLGQAAREVLEQCEAAADHCDLGWPLTRFDDVRGLFDRLVEATR